MAMHTYRTSAKVKLSFSGNAGSMDLRPLANLAFRTLNLGKGGAPYRQYAYDYIVECTTLLLTEVQS